MAQRDFVLAARALGAPPKRLIVRHVIPNVMPIIVVMAVLGTSGTLLLDAGLSFLGLGVPPPTPSWGRMIEEATNLLGYGYLRRRGRESVSQPAVSQ
jgi:peptide/nickel transport system permease protein